MSIGIQVGCGRVLATRYKIPELPKRKQEQVHRQKSNKDEAVKLLLVVDNISIAIPAEEEIWKKRKKEPKTWEEKIKKKEKKVKHVHSGKKDPKKKKKKRKKSSATIIPFSLGSEVREYRLSRGNPASMTWEEILSRHNNGSRNTIFGYIMP